MKSQIGSNKKTSLIVLTGDIMHTKTELSPEAIYIAYHFFAELHSIAPVILIPGNHDCNLSNKSRLDALSPIVEDIGRLQNLFYLKKSGIYQYYNIIFGVTSIFDDRLVSADYISSEVWKGIAQKNKYKIALYHGPVHGAKTDVGYRMNNEQLLSEDFEGYNYVMLGDIHKFQYMDENQTIAYAGSLIQQSYGESLNGHGILKWDLLDGESELFEIRNDYGYCTVNIIDGEMTECKIPRKPRIRFILENTNQVQYQKILASIEKEYQVCEIVKDSSNFKTRLHNNSSKQKKFNKEVTAYTTQESIIKEYLTKKNLEKDKIKTIIALHKKIYQKILEEKKDQVADIMHNATQNQKWKLLELKFTNTMSYGKDNVIDFRGYDPNKIIGIVAPNHYGKSAILDIILFCLFDKISRGDRTDILNTNENKMHCSLLLEIGCQKYLIERIGQRNKNSVKIDVNFYLITKGKNGKETKKELNGTSRTETNKKIIDLIGDYNDYLTTCFCLQQQGKETNFIDMKQPQKKEYLNEILKLNVFKDCYDMAKDKLKALTAQLKILEQGVANKSLAELKDNVKKITLEIKKLTAQKTHMTVSLMENLDYILNGLSQTTLIKYNELSEYDLKTDESILLAINTIKSKLAKISSINYDSINLSITQWRNELVTLEDPNYLSTTGKSNDVVTIRSEIDILLKKIINIPKKINKNDLNILEEETITAKNRIKIIDQLISDVNHNNLSDQIDRITVLKEMIAHLRQELKPTTPDAKKNMIELTDKLANNEKLIKSLFNDDKVFNSKKILSATEITQLTKVIDIKKNFLASIQEITKELATYEIGCSNKNDLVINNTHLLIDKLVEKNHKWITNADKHISDSKEDFIDVPTILKTSVDLNKQMIDASINMFTIDDNNKILKKIKECESELDTLVEFRNTKKEIDNLVQEKTILNEKISFSETKIKELKEWSNHQKSNNDIKKEIDSLQKIIDDETALQNERTNKIKDIKKKIVDNENIIADHKKEIIEKKKLSTHLRLLEEYYLIYTDWCQKNTFYKKWLNVKKEFDNDLNILSQDIEKKQIELAIYKKDVIQYLECVKAFDDKSIDINNYQLYVQVMNYNGLPYEMLKTYLPLIESDVNQILHSMVNFDIEFMFYNEEEDDDDSKEAKQAKQSKQSIRNREKDLATKIGCVNVNICYQGMKPHNVRLASGFERFIIGLAIRMTLCQISLTAKPNFLIIDEGWSCLDTENRGNLTPIMNYIKMQYEHVIIISHLEELKNQADYVINIEKNQGYSFISSGNNLTVKRIDKSTDKSKDKKSGSKSKKSSKSD